MRNKPFSLYLASRFEHAPVLRKIRDEQLAPLGIRVTSRWLELEARADVKRGDWNTQQRKLEAATIDLEDIDASDAVVLDLTFDPTGYFSYGAIFESGYTCGVGGKRLLVIRDN